MRWEVLALAFVLLSTSCTSWSRTADSESSYSGRGVGRNGEESRRRFNPMARPNAPVAQLRTLDWITCALLIATVVSTALLFTPWGSFISRTTPIAFGAATVAGFVARWFVINSETIMNWAFGTTVVTLAAAGAICLFRHYRNRPAASEICTPSASYKKWTSVAA